MSEPTRVRVIRCDCLPQEWRGKRTSWPGMHDGQVGAVVGSTPAGRTLVDVTPGQVACHAIEVETIPA